MGMALGNCPGYEFVRGPRGSLGVAVLGLSASAVLGWTGWSSLGRGAGRGAGLCCPEPQYTERTGTGLAHAWVSAKELA